MGYRMEYGAWNEEVVYREYRRKYNKHYWMIIASVLILCFILRGYIIDIVFPGDKEVTKAAVSTFVRELKNGENVTEAFGTFCRVILDDAEIS